MSRVLQAVCSILLAANSVGIGTAVAAGAQVLPQPAVDEPVESAGSVNIEPAPARARSTRRLVYTCVEPGLVTYSDRPCGPIASRRELQVLTPAPAPGAGPNVVGPDAPPVAQRRTAAAARSEAAAAHAAEVRAETCSRLEAAADEVESQMRAGYPAREAGRMWERWREARARLREARC